MNPYDIVAFIVICLLLVGLIVFVCIRDSERASRPATVIEKVYAPSSTGIGTTSSGKVATTFHSEKWKIVVKDDNGNFYSVSVSPEKWAAVKPGDRINGGTAK